MKKKITDEEFLKLVEDILDNKEFNKLGDINHHGITRLDHSIRVSYYSYKITKSLGLNYEITARAGMLHDFFISNIDRTKKERFLSTFTHPKYAVENSLKNFDIDEIGKNIIESHMFPIYKSLPKYSESWIVSLVDKISAIFEFAWSFNKKIVYYSNIILIIIINYIK